MKKLLFLVLLAGCTGTSIKEGTEQAVTTYLRKTLDDPSSYQPASWGKILPYTKADAAHALGKRNLVMAAFLAQQANEYAKQAAEFVSPGNLNLEAVGEKNRISNRFTRASDSVSRLAPALLQSTDTTVIGHVVTHVFRAKNKLGGLVLDSARFLVLKNGSVTRQSLD